MRWEKPTESHPVVSHGPKSVGERKKSSYSLCLSNSWRCFSCETRGHVEIVVERGRGFVPSFVLFFFLSQRSALTRGKTRPFLYFQQCSMHLSVRCISFFSPRSGHDKGCGHVGLECTLLVSVSKLWADNPLKRAGEEEWKYCMSVSVLLPDRKPAVTNCQKVYWARSIQTVCARSEHTDVNQVSKYTFFFPTQCHFL